MSDTIYRIQDKDGRGPYKPGKSHEWLDEDNIGETQPSVFDQFGMNWQKGALYGQYVGCAFRNIDQLYIWFSPTELRRLMAKGYRIVSMDDVTILRESANQCVFVRNRPFKEGIIRIPTPETLHQPR